MTAQPRFMAVLYAVDSLRLARFYVAVMELELADAEGGNFLRESPALELFVVGVPEGVATATAVTEPPEPREDRAIKLTFTVQDIAASRGRAEATGGLVLPVECEWHFRSQRVCDGHDPEGNVIQLRQLQA